MKTIWKSMLALVLLLSFVGCSDNDGSNEAQGTAQLNLRLVDAPGDYDAVFIDVQDVVVKYQGSNDEVPLGIINAGVYDLLQLTGGVSVLLVDGEIPAGDVSQMRLILGEDNSIVVNGESYPLATPSAQQSGLKIQLHQILEEDVFYEYILDFDVNQSIVVQGNGNYLLKPVINASLVADAGKIAGMVLPLEIQTLVTATNVDGTIEVSSYVSPEGDYVLYGLPQGIYTVLFEADPLLGFPPVTISDVEVVAGLTSVLEDVIFE